MSQLDIEGLLQPCSESEPSGPNLEFDADFMALEEATRGKPEQQYGQTIIPAEPPEWREVSRLARKLLPRTKDLRVACHFARAMVECEGVATFCESLGLIRGMVERYWETLHPQLDPDDGNDPTERMNILSSLADTSSTIPRLNQSPLIRSRLIGPISMRDVEVAHGLAKPIGDDKHDIATIEAAFMDCDTEELSATFEAIQRGYDDVVATEAKVTDIVGAAQSVNLEELTDMLKSLAAFMRKRIDSRGGQASDDEETETESAPADSGNEPAATPARVGELRTRDDIVRMIDKICDYYDRYEPSSPVPLLLKRAQRLVTKDFLSILEDMAPDGVSQAKLISGVDAGDD